MEGMQYLVEGVTQSESPESLLHERPEFPDSVVEAARQYHLLGLNTIPLQRGKKTPAGKWKNLQMYRRPERTIDTDFPGKNIGVLTGSVSGNLLVIDCDTSEAFDKYRSIAEEHGFAKWLVETNRGGHIWLRYEGGKVANYAKQEQDGDCVEFWAESNRYVVAPPSVNDETGLVYTWLRRDGELPPLLNVQTIKTMFPCLHVRPDSDLPDVAYQVLIEGNTSKYGGNNSAAEYAAACSLVKAGYGNDEIKGLFEEHEPPHYAERNEQWFEEYVLIPARKEVKPLRDRELIQRVVAWIQAQPWPGISGSTDKKVLLAFTERAKLESETSARMTYREAGQIAGVERTTAGRSIERLIAAGLLKEVPTKGNKGKRYGLGESLCDDAINNTVFCNTGINQVTFQKHDVWKSRALGATSLEVYTCLLNQGPLPAKEIVNRIGKGESAVWSSLRKLRKVGLVTKTKKLYKANSANDEHLDNLAAEFGTLGVQSKREQRFQREREVYNYIRK